MRLFELIRKAWFGRTRYQWDREYATGRWDYFREPGEEARYKALLQFITQYLGGDRTILEIGCGEGILQARMAPGSYSRFLGIDISKVAVRRAARLSDQTTDYRAANMETYIPRGKYDLIIFNEVLYYSADPMRLMKRYAAFLRPGGLILASLNETKKSLEIMQTLEQEFGLVDQRISTYERGAWHCKVYSQTQPGAPFPNALQPVDLE